VHRVDSIDVLDGSLVVRSRVAPAGTDVGIDVEYRWTATASGVRVTVRTQPVGTWDVPLPRLGLRLALSGDLDRLTWFGAGPGESYPDSTDATRIGRFASTVDDLQTPYLHPQENGARRSVRWAELTGPATAGLRVTADPAAIVTVRRWTSDQLEKARHPYDLTPGPSVWVNLDHEHHGLGSASCGPPPLQQHVLVARPATWSLELADLTGG